MKNIKIPFVLFLVFACIASSSVFAKVHEISASLHLGNQFRYGQQYSSLNAPQGLNGLNASTANIASESFRDTNGLLLDLTFRYDFMNRFFFEVGGEYVYGLETKGRYPLRDPFSGQIYLLNSITQVPTKGSAQLSHIGVPATLGLVISFWDEMKLYLGVGAGYYFTTQKMVQQTGDSTILDFNYSYEVKPTVLAFHAKLTAEYMVIGTAEDSSSLSINAGITIIRGQSSSVSDSKTDTLPSATPAFPLLANDSVKVDLSGYRFFAGVTYYIMRK